MRNTCVWRGYTMAIDACTTPDQGYARQQQNTASVHKKQISCYTHGFAIDTRLKLARHVNATPMLGYIARQHSQGSRGTPLGQPQQAVTDR